MRGLIGITIRCALLTSGLSSSSALWAAEQRNDPPQVGDYILAERAGGSILTIDPVTGLIRGTISGQDLRQPPGEPIGDGPPLSGAHSLSPAIAPDGGVFVRFSHPSGWGMLDVNIQTGDRATLSGTDGAAWASSGEFFLLDDGRTLISTADDFSNGPNGDGLVLAYDLETGQTTVLSGGGIGDGPRLVTPRGIALLDEDTVLIAESLVAQPWDIGAGLYAVSISTGDRIFLSRLTPAPFERTVIVDGQPVGTVILGDDEGGIGPVTNVAARSIALLDGVIYIGIAIRDVFQDEYDGGLLAIDPMTGDRALAVGRAIDDDGAGITIIEQLPSNQSEVFLDQPMGLTPLPGSRLVFTCLFGPKAIFEFEPATVELNLVADLGTQIHPDWIMSGIQLHGLAIYTGSGCAADINQDGVIDTRDIVLFLNLWAIGDDRADFNSDGVIDTRDVVTFLNLWVVGCG